MFVMGGSATGGRVMTQWPGLAAGQLYQNQDLQVTIDYRDILAEIVVAPAGQRAARRRVPGLRADVQRRRRLRRCRSADALRRIADDDHEDPNRLRASSIFD